MKINHNIPAIRTLNELSKVNNKAASSMLNLSSGLKINKASDDAAGLAIVNKMDAQVKGLRQANRNTMDGVSMVQTAEGALNEVHAILQRMRELAVQAANSTYTENDKKEIQEEINRLTSEINRIGETTEFNEKALLRGNGANGEDIDIRLQIGANKGQVVDVTISDMRANALGITGVAGEDGFTDENTVEDGDGKNNGMTSAAVKVTDFESAEKAIKKFDTAIDRVSSQRSKLGSMQNRLEHTTSNLGVSEENLTASISNLQDADMAYEMSQYTQQNVISQAAMAMLAQANQRPQHVLQLLN
ncbi:MAG: flagellin [Cellulosilyticaceae bacterium]